MPSSQAPQEYQTSGSRFMPRRKTPPPTFINLDDCKPILSTTTTNTSTNSSKNGTTAFVFTSSRTLRALQDEEDRQKSPGLPAVPTPGTPPTPSSAASSYSARSRAQLTLSQLTKHSEGAIDARSLIGPKMRAAGFVDLPHTLGPRPDHSVPRAPSSPSPTFSSRALWHSPSSLRGPTAPKQTGSETASNEDTPGPVQTEFNSFFLPVSAALAPAPSRPPCQVVASQSSQSSGTDSSGLHVSSSSSSTLVSSGSSASTGLTSVEETDEDSREVRDKGKGKVRETELSEYPFPPSFEYSPSVKSARSHGSRASSVTASPTVYAGHTRTSSACIPTVQLPPLQPQDPHAPKPLSPSRDQRTLNDSRQRLRAKEKSIAQPTPSFASAKRPQTQHQLSLTELCDASPFVWLTKSDMFVPPAPIARSPVRASSVFPTSLSTPRVQPSLDAPPTRRHLTAPDRLPTLASTGRHHRIPSEPLRLATISSEHGASSPEQESEKAHPSRKTRVRGVAKLGAITDSSRTAIDGADIPRWSHAVIVSGAPAPIQDFGGGPGVRLRGRATRGKPLGASEAARERAAAEEMDLELEMAKQGLAALVLARRERDREYARHVAADRERDKLMKQKQRIHHKLRETPLRDGDGSEPETTMVDHALAATVKTVD
ncbi:hypothetical protein C2E23DRAFT_97293 [Lenzites betulinus]|nr:hypothetical protein C2E23DRAFT_97293 [Lenzites betulinus]